jgi:hypothetical protein
MKIVYLGFGSLLWNFDELSLSSEWIKSDDLKLPLEYSRISRDGRMTLVIDEINGTYNNIRYAISKNTNVNKAIKNLKIREKTTKQNIGYINRNNGKSRTMHMTDKLKSVITNWMIQNNIDVVIWTNLQPKWINKNNIIEKYDIKNAFRYYYHNFSNKEMIKYIQKSTYYGIVTRFNKIFKYDRYIKYIL